MDDRRSSAMDFQVQLLVTLLLVLVVSRAFAVASRLPVLLPHGPC